MYYLYFYLFVSLYFSGIIDHNPGTPKSPIPKNMSFGTLQKQFNLSDICELCKDGMEVTKNLYCLLTCFLMSCFLSINILLMFANTITLFVFLVYMVL